MSHGFKSLYYLVTENDGSRSFSWYVDKTSCSFVLLVMKGPSADVNFDL